MTLIARTRAEFDQWRATVDEVTVVLTMGALHDGHASLVTIAKATGLPVVITVFVNPTQFAAGEDLDRYPRTEAADIALARSLEVDCIWLPTTDDIYPPDEQVEQVEPGSLAEVLEGAVRPGHFAGVLMVVNRFFSIIRPSIAVFGKKDRQQLILIETMVRSRGIPVRVLPGETLRESDGLAMSSRNRYLDAVQRGQALALSRSLFAARSAAASGARVPGILESAHAELGALAVDYCVVTDPLLNAVDEGYCGPAVMLVAARVGTTRLIDNIDMEIACP
jgi:pantoate--beta-alanine ligase